MDKLETRQWPILAGLILAVVGVIAPILWDLFRSNAALELKQTGRTVLIQRNDVLEKLRVDYGGQAIKELSSIRFELANTGSKPIRDTDLVAPPVIHFQGTHLILDARIESTFPQNLMATVSQTNSPPTVTVKFPLLNPGDNVQFVVLIADSLPVTFEADARIVGLSKMKVTVQPVEPVPTGRQPSSVVWAVGIFSVFSLLIAVIGATDIPKERRFKKLVADNRLQIPVGLTKESGKPFVASQLSWATGKENKPIVDFLDSLPAGQLLTDAERDQLLRTMVDCSSSATSNAAVVFAFGIIAAIGIAYFFAQGR